MWQISLFLSILLYDLEEQQTPPQISFILRNEPV